MYYNKISLFVVVALFAYSCGDDDDARPSGSFTVKVNDQDWTAVGAEASLVNGVLGIVGTNADDETILLTITSPSEDTYILDHASPHVMVYAPVKDSVGFSSNALLISSARIVLTQFDTAALLVSGTFEGNLHPTDTNMLDNVVLSEGQFSGLELVLDAPNTGNSSMSASIDGAAWTSTGTTAFANYGILSIGGDNATDNNSILLFVSGNASVGTHSLEMFTDYFAQFSDGLGVTAELYSVDNGTITISNHNVGSVLDATFEFTASTVDGTKTVTITNGTVHVEY